MADFVRAFKLLKKGSSKNNETKIERKNRETKYKMKMKEEARRKRVMDRIGGK